MHSLTKTSCLLLSMALAAFADVSFADVVTSDAVEPAIAVMSTDARHEVFREHEGPYWSIAPTIDQVRDYMVKLNERGPIFVRYIPAGSPARRQPYRIEVGFVTKAQPEVLPPFQYVEHAAELVAGMRVTPDQASPSRSLPRLRAWALSRGYEVPGILTEIHSLAVQPGDAREPVEVQLVIREVGPVAKTPDKPIDESQDELPEHSRLLCSEPLASARADSPVPRWVPPLDNRYTKTESAVGRALPDGTLSTPPGVGRSPTYAIGGLRGGFWREAAAVRIQSDKFPFAS